MEQVYISMVMDLFSTNAGTQQTAANGYNQGRLPGK